MRKHLGESKDALLSEFEDVVDEALTDDAWNALASLTQLQLSSLMVWLVRAMSHWERRDTAV